jgi:hypothetical protein
MEKNSIAAEPEINHWILHWEKEESSKVGIKSIARLSYCLGWDEGLLDMCVGYDLRGILQN